MDIRKFVSDDLGSVIKIFRSNIPKYFGPEEEPGLRDFLTRCPENYFVCTIENEVIGAGGFAANTDSKTVSLCWGMMRCDHIGKGRGKELTAFRIEKAREMFGDRPIVISTSQHTEGFYKRLGFVLTRHEPDGFGPGIDICEMRLDLEGDTRVE